jgi:hypothetical protein
MISFIQLFHTQPQISFKKSLFAIIINVASCVSIAADSIGGKSGHESADIAHKAVR